MATVTRWDALLDGLAGAVGSANVLSDPDTTAPFATDWSRRYSGDAIAVVRPSTTAEAAAVVSLCADHGAPMVAQGGNTGLVNGSVPAPDQPAVIISTRRLTRLDPVDHLQGQVTAGAGVTLGELRRHAQAAGWEYGVDLAARDSATVGGTVATNAGGIRVIAYGMTRAQVTGIEAVLPSGQVIDHLGGLLKDNTGYDLAGLLTGSEGTLGLITAVRLRLHRPPRRSTVAMLGASSYAESLAIMASAVAPGFRLLAAEVVDEKGMDLAAAIIGETWPLERRHPLVVLLEVEDDGTADGLVIDDDADAVVAVDSGDKQRLWSFRERQAEAFAALGFAAHHLDVSVPLARLAECADELRRRLDGYAGIEAYGVFGHLGDGNIHVEIAGPSPDDDDVDLLVLGAVAAYGGSISAEHGVGRAKAHLLGLCRSQAEIGAMRAMKAALDPQALMNPGVIFPLAPSAS